MLKVSDKSKETKMVRQKEMIVFTYVYIEWEKNEINDIVEIG